MKVELSLQSLHDLSAIMEYVGKQNPRAAVRLVEAIERTCQTLGGMPIAGTARDDLKTGLRAFSHGIRHLLSAENGRRSANCSGSTWSARPETE